MQTDNNRADMPGMKWHNFIIHVAMWGLLTSSAFGVYNSIAFRDLYSEVFSMPEGVYLAFAAAYGAVGVFTLISRFFLAQFRKHGPVMGNISIAAGLMMPMLLRYIQLYTAKNEFDIIATLITAAEIAIIVIPNVIYYRKRAYLFVN